MNNQLQNELKKAELELALAMKRLNENLARIQELAKKEIQFHDVGSIVRTV